MYEGIIEEPSRGNVRRNARRRLWNSTVVRSRQEVKSNKMSREATEAGERRMVCGGAAARCSDPINQTKKKLKQTQRAAGRSHRCPLRRCSADRGSKGTYRYCCRRAGSSMNFAPISS